MGSRDKFCEKQENRGKFGCPKQEPCCQAMTAECLACKRGISVRKFCKKYKNRGKFGCPKQEPCCQAMTAECLACKRGISVRKYCKKYKKQGIKKPGCSLFRL